MTIGEAIAMGIVHGLSEFLPISETGHFAILNSLFELSTAGSNLMFRVLLNAGTLIAVIISFWKELREMVFQLLGLMKMGPYRDLQRTHYPGARLLLLQLTASLPLLLVISLRKAMDQLFAIPFFVGVILILNGLVLYAADHMTPGAKNEGNMSFLDALIVGLCECVSIIPGFSRTGVTLTAGLATGLDRKFAVRFSLLLTIPLVFVRTIMDLVDAIDYGFALSDMPAFLVGTAAALVTAMAAILLVRQLIGKSGRIGTFSYYCLILGVLFIILTVIF